MKQWEVMAAVIMGLVIGLLFWVASGNPLVGEVTAVFGGLFCAVLIVRFRQ